MKRNISEKSRSTIYRLCTKHGGLLTAAEATHEGIQPRDLYALRDEKTLEQLTRGLFRHRDFPKLKSPDLSILNLKIPTGVLSLNSALAFHGLVENFPPELQISLPQGAQRPRNFPFPHQFFFISKAAFECGILVKTVDTFPVRVYDMEKTIIDCFKFRKRIGLEICLKGLRNWLSRKDKRFEKLHKYSKVCRMGNIVAPYLDALS